MQYDFLHFLSHCKAGCRLLTYNNLDMMHEDVCHCIDAVTHERKVNGIVTHESYTKPTYPWKRLKINTIESGTGGERADEMTGSGGCANQPEGQLT